MQWIHFCGLKTEVLKVFHTEIYCLYIRLQTDWTKIIPNYLRNIITNFSFFFKLFRSFYYFITFTCRTSIKIITLNCMWLFSLDITFLNQESLTWNFRSWTTTWKQRASYHIHWNLQLLFLYINCSFIENLPNK